MKSEKEGRKCRKKEGSRFRKVEMRTKLGLCIALSYVWLSHYFSALDILSECWTIARRAKPKTNDVY